MGFRGRTVRGGGTWRRICGLLVVGGLLLPGIGAASADTVGRARTADAVGGREPSIAVPYRVAELWRQGITGRGTTVAVLVSYGDPGLERFMRDYDAQYGLPAADIRRVEPLGKPPSCTSPGVDTESCQAWASETRLDVAMVHSLAPQARIVVAASPVDETQGESGMPEMMRVLDHLTRHRLADVVSMSFGSVEQNFADSASVLAYGATFDRARAVGTTLVASSGDLGASGPLRDHPDRHYPRRVVAWPASDPRVTAVGGSLLHVDPQGHRTSPDTLWPKSGAGHSSLFARPAWQRTATAGDTTPGRSVPDIVMQGSAGTSQSAPLFAGVLALAAQLHQGALGDINPALYRLCAARPTAGIVDVTEGANTYAEVHGFTAGPGFDTASGWGTVDVPRFVRALARAVT
ncbi:Subtilase family protein [Streptomyces sp. 2224.1]|uniref:S53 family peptidase n=1 Tax=Streptomyces sp. 2224.1 TaxID=1881020 RepID=UPI0008981B3B|nr:S53 family peptidase [Streptomyces sp. 2224.1]SEB98469.1 Subtilase family protein [Streptomyces sp. 2224.1]